MGPFPSDAPAPAAERTRLARITAWLAPFTVVVLLTFAAGVVFANILPTRAELAATRRRLAAQAQENDRLRRRIAVLEAAADRLENDPWATERILRDEFRMSGEDEVIVR